MRRVGPGVVLVLACSAVAFAAGWFAGRRASGERLAAVAPNPEPQSNAAPPEPRLPERVKEPAAPAAPRPQASGELESLRREVAELRQRRDQVDQEQERRRLRRRAIDRARDEDFTQEALTLTIAQVMREAGLPYQLLAVDCATAPCLFFGKFEFDEPVMMDAWMRFRERMYDIGRPFFSTQWQISDKEAVFAIAPSRDRHDPDQLMTRARPILEQLANEARSAIQDAGPPGE